MSAGKLGEVVGLYANPGAAPGSPTSCWRSTCSVYEKIIVGLGKENFETQLAAGSARVGTPADIVEKVAHYAKIVSGFESASPQVNFNTVSLAAAERSMRVFSEQVMPKFQF